MKDKKNVFILCGFLLLLSISGLYYTGKNSPNNHITGLVVQENANKEFQNNLEKYYEQYNKNHNYETYDFDTFFKTGTSESIAFNTLIKAEEELKEMKSFGLSVLYIQDALLKAKRFFVGKNVESFRKFVVSVPEEKGIVKTYLELILITAEQTPEYELENQDLSKTIEITKEISIRKQKAMKLLDMMSLLEKKEKNYNKEGVDTFEGFELLQKGRQALEGERYSEAENYFNEANESLEVKRIEFRRYKRIIILGKSFFARYWWQILIVLAVISASISPVIKHARKKRAKKKVVELKLEEKTIFKLIKKAQTDCFQDKKITQELYKIKEEKYKSRLIEIKRMLPVFENIAVGKKPSKIKKKHKEKKGIIVIKKEKNDSN